MSDARRRHERGSQGFTLIEVMLALVILAVGMLTLAVMQLQALKQGSQGKHTGDGTAIARSYLEQTNRLPWSVLTTAQTAGGWQTPGNDWPGKPVTVVSVDRPDGLAASTDHNYTIQWRVTDIGAAPVCLRDVEVKVSWTEDGSSTTKQHVIGTRRYHTGDPNC
ncbi:MAG TPA: prepilin-type N-terminal cleavage/methylation domain-containing protein [Myxococcota bacterium]|nr:prepilin-type N-terminal cleavage/methylation domain-containing protein [Myxococcota bacterium]